MIDRLVAGRRQPAGVTVGPGDDAAVVAAARRPGRGRRTDMLVEGRHFRLDWSTPHDVGRKAIAQNAADIEAMGARTTAFVVAFGAPQDTPVPHGAANWPTECGRRPVTSAPASSAVIWSPARSG